MRLLERIGRTSAVAVVGSSGRDAEDRAGDRAAPAFGAEVARLRAALFARAYFLARDRDLADDLVQETITRALSGAARFRCGSNLKAWLNVILYNLFIDSRRRQVRTVPVDDEVAGPAWREPDEEQERQPCGEQASGGRIDVREAIELVSFADIKSVVASLPHEQGEVFVLAYLEGQSYREIARRTKVPVSTVGTRLVRAKGKIRDGLERVCDERRSVRPA